MRWGPLLGALLEQVSGVSSISTGTAIAKTRHPGMYGNRILIINNGTRQKGGQQWGGRSCSEVDMNDSNSIQVVKGSDAVRYGSEALGDYLSWNRPCLSGQSHLKGKGSMLYGSNGRRFVLPDRWRNLPFSHVTLPGVYRNLLNSGDRSTANYLLNNTGTRNCIPPLHSAMIMAV